MAPPSKKVASCEGFKVFDVVDVNDDIGFYAGRKGTVLDYDPEKGLLLVQFYGPGDITVDAWFHVEDCKKEEPKIKPSSAFFKTHMQ